MGRRSRLLEIVPNFLLFFLFACCMFFVLISGAKSYKNVTAVMEEQFSVNTCISYVTAKVRHYDSKDAVTVGKIGEADALLFKEKIDASVRNDPDFLCLINMIRVEMRNSLPQINLLKEILCVKYKIRLCWS